MNQLVCDVNLSEQAELWRLENELNGVGVEGPRVVALHRPYALRGFTLGEAGERGI